MIENTGNGTGGHILYPGHNTSSLSQAGWEQSSGKYLQSKGDDEGLTWLLYHDIGAYLLTGRDETNTDMTFRVIIARENRAR